MAILIGAGLLVAALVVWALTRTVEPASVMATATTADATTTFTPPPAGTTAAPATMPTPAGAFDPSAPTASMPTATMAPPPQPQGNRAEVKRIAAEDLRAQLGRNAVTVIDVRTSADYARGHIPGSINIPFASVETQFETIPKDKPIVTYCT